jgi:polysaccharide export outer membrane protein
MFKPPKDYPFEELVVDTSHAEYRIQPNDVVSFGIYTNEGAIILENSTGPADNRVLSSGQFIDYPVDANGFVELPIIGSFKISGYTIFQAQEAVEIEFAKMYNSPFVTIRVLKRSVIVFTSPAGNGKVLELGGQSVSVIQALAQAGGIGPEAIAKRIYLFRDENGVKHSYLIDLSTIDGIRYADTPVESGDVIYVTSRPNIPTKAAAQIRPLVLLLSSTSAIFSLLFILGK